MPQSYFQAPDPYHDATSNGVSLLALSKYARSQNKRIVDLSHKEINDCCGKAKKGDEKTMGIEEKLANAKKTRWLAEGLTDEEVEQIVKKARENAKKVRKNIDEAAKEIHN